MRWLTYEAVKGLQSGIPLGSIIAAQEQLQQDTHDRSAGDGGALLGAHLEALAAADAGGRWALLRHAGARQLDQRLAHRARQREHQQRVARRRPEPRQP